MNILFIINPVVKFGCVSANNAASALITPTYDGSGQAVHPDIYYNANSWNSYKYWMAFTPYPNSNDDYENPSILVSNDGDNWIVPPGLTNPIVPFPGGADHLADTDLIMGYDNKLYLTYGKVVGTLSTCYYVYSVDGVNWSAPAPLNITTIESIGSQSILKRNDIYEMYYVDGSTSPNRIRKITSTDLTGNWSPAETINLIGIPTGKEIWHLEIMPYYNDYHALFVLCDLNTGGANTLLYFSSNTDGINFEIKLDPIITKSVSGWDNDIIYRASAVLMNDRYEYYDCFYSARSSVGLWRIGKTRLNIYCTPPFNTITLQSSIETEAQTVTEGNPITDIVYSTTGATGATFTNLPAGVTGSWINDIITISGTPTVTGNFNFTINLTGGYGTVNRSGNISVNQFIDTSSLLPDLFALWKFNETAGAIAADTTINANDLTIDGATLAQPGKIGYAFLFDGVNDVLSSPARIITAFPLTISLWIKVESTGLNRISTNIFGAPTYGVEIAFDYNQLVVEFGDGGGNGVANRKTYVLANTTIPATWYHVAVTFQSHGVFTYYVNAIQRNLTLHSGTASFTNFQEGILKIGQSWGAGSFYAKGTIDQVAIWNRILSTEEINLLYNSGNGIDFP